MSMDRPDFLRTKMEKIPDEVIEQSVPVYGAEVQYAKDANTNTKLGPKCKSFI